MFQLPPVNFGNPAPVNFGNPAPVSFPIQNPILPQFQQANSKKLQLVYVMLGDEEESVYLSCVQKLVELAKTHKDPFKILMKDHKSHKHCDIVQILQKEIGDRIKDAFIYPSSLSEKFRDCQNDLLTEAVLTRFFVEQLFYQGEYIQLVIVSSNYRVPTASYIYHNIFKDHARISANHSSCNHTEEELKQQSRRLNQELDYMQSIIQSMRLTNGCIYSLWNALHSNLIFEVNREDNKISDYQLRVKV